MGEFILSILRGRRGIDLSAFHSFRTTFPLVMRGLDPRIHADVPCMRTCRKCVQTRSQHGLPDQVRQRRIEDEIQIKLYRNPL